MLQQGGFALSENDFTLKTLVRQLFWHEGFSTRINVKLSALIPRDASKTWAPLEEYTDLDVLGVTFAPDFRLRLKIADCKISPKRIPERLFWLQGVRDFFRADDSYLVRPSNVSSSSRQLAARLGISLLTGKDLHILMQIITNESDLSSASFFFDGSSYLARERTLSSLEAKLAPLQKYRVSYYWLLHPYQNLQQLLVYLREFQPHLRAENKSHLNLFLDYVWLYALALLQAIEYVVASGVSDIDRSMKHYLFGGEVGLREKEATVKRLKELRNMLEGEQATSAKEIFTVLPPYYDGLLELVTRFVRKPQSSSHVLRYSEWLNLSKGFLKDSPQLPSTLLPIDQVSVKLLNDVARFLTEASGVKKDFSAKFVDLSNRAFPA